MSNEPNELIAHEASHCEDNLMYIVPVEFSVLEP